MTPRLFVIEGPDGSGKSTLLAKLEKDLNRVSVHSGGPPLDRAAWINKMAITWGCVGRRIIMDRIPHISELCYGPIFGREPYDPVEFLDRELMDLRPIVVYCRLPSINAMMNAISMAAKDHKPPEHTQGVLLNYPRLVANYDKRIRDISHLVTIIPYSWQDDDYTTLKERLLCADLF